MMRPAPDVTVYLCVAPVELRKQAASLALLVEQSLGHNVFDTSLYVFTNRKRDRVRKLSWERNGLCLWSKRVEKQQFIWPRLISGETVGAERPRVERAAGWLRYMEPRPACATEVCVRPLPCGHEDRAGAGAHSASKQGIARIAGTRSLRSSSMGCRSIDKRQSLCAMTCLARGTQAAWTISVVSPIMPLLNLMDERVRSSGYVRIDETPIQVLKSDKAPSADHWMWVRVAGPPGQRLILFGYDASRGSHVATRLPDGARGYPQSDGYAAYDGVGAQLQLTHLGWFAHARRRFFEAVQALPKPKQKKTTVAHEFVRGIDALYAIERDIKAPSDEARLLARQTR